MAAPDVYSSLTEIGGAIYTEWTDAEPVKNGLQAKGLKTLWCGADQFRTKPIPLPSTLTELSLDDDDWEWRSFEGDPRALQFGPFVGNATDGFTTFPPQLRSLTLRNLLTFHPEEGLARFKCEINIFRQVGGSLRHLSWTFADPDPFQPRRGGTFPPLLHLLPHLTSLHMHNCSVEPLFLSPESRHPTLQLLSFGCFLPTSTPTVDPSPRQCGPIEELYGFQEGFASVSSALQVKFIDQESPEVDALEWKSRFPSLTAIQIRAGDWREIEQSSSFGVREVGEFLLRIGVEIWDGRGIAWTGREVKQESSAKEESQDPRQLFTNLKNFAYFIQPPLIPPPRSPQLSPANHPSTPSTAQTTLLPPHPLPSQRRTPKKHRSLPTSSLPSTLKLKIPNIEYFLSQLPLDDNIVVPPSLSLSDFETPPDIFVRDRLGPASARDILVAWDTAGGDLLTRYRWAHKVLDAMLDDDRHDALAAIAYRKHILQAILERRIGSTQVTAKNSIYTFLASLPPPPPALTVNDATEANAHEPSEGEVDDLVSSDDEPQDWD